MNRKRNLVVLLALTIGVSAGLCQADPRRDHALLVADYEGQTPTVRDLLARGAHIEAQDGQYGMTPLLWASWRGQLGTVRYLLSKGARVNARSREGVPVTMGVGRDYGGFSQETVEENTKTTLTMHLRGFQYNRSGGVTALMLAAAGGYGLTVRELLAKGADPNLKNPEGYTALWNAAFKGYMPAVEVLLAQGADVNAVDNYNQSALFAAVSQGHTPVVKALLAKGARAGIRTVLGYTPLMLASHFRYRDIVRLLRVAEAKERNAAKQAAKSGNQRQQAISPQPYVFMDQASDTSVDFLN